MSISMYEASIPLFLHHLDSLDKLLDKAAESAAARNFDSSILCSARLAPDMFPLTRQVQIACDMAKACGARLTGIEIPKFEDSESSLPELKARIAKTADFLRSLNPEQFVGAEDRQISYSIPGRTLNFTGKAYLITWVWPNFYFHYTTAYALLRHNGVGLGKLDYLGAN